MSSSDLPAKPKEATDKVSKTLGRAYPRVRVLQEDYTVLTWLFGRKPNESQLKKATEYSFTRSVELSGGDAKTLKGKDMVSATAANPPDLLPGRQRLVSTWTKSACSTIRSKGEEFVSVRRVSDITSFRQMLLACDELEACFAKRHRAITKED